MAWIVAAIKALVLLGIGFAVFYGGMILLASSERLRSVVLVAAGLGIFVLMVLNLKS